MALLSLSSLPTVSAPGADAEFADVLLASGWLEVLSWEDELAASQSDAHADELASIRAVIANALAWTGAAEPQPEPEEAVVEEEDDDEPEEPDWTSRWYALRPSGLHMYSIEQKAGETWEAPALSIPMSEVLSATAATGARPESRT